MASLKCTVEVYLITEVIRLYGLVALVLDAAFRQVGSDFIGFLVPCGGRIDMRTHGKGVFIVNVRVVRIVTLVLELCIVGQTLQEPDSETALNTDIHLGISQLAVLDFGNRVIAPVAVREVLRWHIAVQYRLVERPCQISAVAVLVHQHVVWRKLLSVCQRIIIPGSINTAIIHAVVLHHTGKVEIQPFE